MEVLIVGGGIAGLTAAYHLKNEGINVKVLEKNRVGGRILSHAIDLGDRIHYQDMGAEYFISADTTLLDLVNDLQLEKELYISQRAVHNLNSGKSMILPSSTDSFWKGIQKKLKMVSYVGFSNLSSASKIQAKLPDFIEKINYLYQTLENATIENAYTEFSEKHAELTSMNLLQYLTSEGFSFDLIMKMIDPLFHAIYMLDAKQLVALFGVLGFAAKNHEIYHIKGVGNEKIIHSLVEKIGQENIISARVDSIKKENGLYSVAFSNAQNERSMLKCNAVFLAVPHASLNTITIEGLNPHETEVLNRMKGIPYNSEVYHHLIKGEVLPSIRKVFSQGADTVFIAYPESIVEINKIHMEGKIGVFDITSSREYNLTDFNNYFRSWESIKSQHWVNAYPKFDAAYFEKYPKPKINDSFYVGTDSYVSSMGNAVLLAKLIAENIIEVAKLKIQPLEN